MQEPSQPSVTVYSDTRRESGPMRVLHDLMPIGCQTLPKRSAIDSDLPGTERRKLVRLSQLTGSPRAGTSAVAPWAGNLPMRVPS